MIAVTGATGHLGRLVIAALLRNIPPESVIAAARSEEKARDLAAQGVQVRIADYNDPSAWDRALEGAERVLLISASDIGQRVRQHRSVIDAARRARVELLSYTSILHADRSPLRLASEHRETEGIINASGVPHVFLRNSWYTENYLAGIPAALARGVMYGCAGEGRIASAAKADYAEAAAAVMTADGQEGRVYELAGDTAYTLAELAAEISRQSGISVRYVNMSEEEYRSMLEKAGFPSAVAALLADSQTGISRGALFDDSRRLSSLIRRPTTSLAASVKAMLQTKSSW